MIPIRYTLKELRARKRMNQKQVAEALGMNEAYYICIEKLDANMVKKLASFYGVKPQEIDLPMSST